MLKKMLRIKSVSQILKTVGESAFELKKTIGVIELIALGIGAIVGAGIFVITGTAAAGAISSAGEVLRAPAGPAITLSFIITAAGCCFCAMCYAELASMIPASGSAYTYAYVSMGEIFAWIIGWCLLLEYTFDAVTVSIGWSGYMQQLLEQVLHIKLPQYLLTPTFVAFSGGKSFAHFPMILGHPLAINLPATVIIFLLSLLLIRGVKESTRFNNIVVCLKIAVVLVVIFVGAYYVKPENWIPFMPYGFRGVLAGASLIFFAYIGFDALSTAAEEVKNPGRDLPLGIIGSLVICTVLYIAVAAILTGMTPYKLLNTPDPVATAMNYVGQNFLASYIVSVGAVIALCSTLLVFLYGQPRIIFAMARDGFFPKRLAKVHPKYRTPYIPTIISGTIVMFLAGMCDLSDVAALCNSGTLVAFMMVCVSVIVLRHTQPDQPRKFRTPFVPLFPILGILVSAVLFFSLPRTALYTFVIWTACGLTFYFAYGIRHTKYDGGK